MQSPINEELNQAHNELSDIEFARQFENLQLNPELFTHEAHLRLAWIYSYIFDIDKAIVKIRNGIKSFDGKFGDGTKYHETISVFMIKLIFERERKKLSITFKQFKNSNQDLFQKNKALLSVYYSIDVMSDSKAKVEYRKPDLKEIS